ncbi:hypothetical protein, partial [Vibrio parahaemolyticus]|uniref:hypothetical protein n=1 Tax=Vibrio parahaemolyticus TaxID=670 RepID=UPI002111A231
MIFAQRAFSLRPAVYKIKKEQNDDELLFGLCFLLGVLLVKSWKLLLLYRRKHQIILALLFYDRLDRGISK